MLLEKGEDQTERRARIEKGTELSLEQDDVPPSRAPGPTWLGAHSSLSALGLLLGALKHWGFCPFLCDSRGEKLRAKAALLHLDGRDLSFEDKTLQTRAPFPSHRAVCPCTAAGSELFSCLRSSFCTELRFVGGDVSPALQICWH